MVRPSQLRFALRMLVKNPGTSVLAVAAFALGIGLTTSMFSIVHGVLRSRVPFADPHRLMDLVVLDAEEGPLGVLSPESRTPTSPTIRRRPAAWSRAASSRPTEYAARVDPLVALRHD